MSKEHFNKMKRGRQKNWLLTNSAQTSRTLSDDGKKWRGQFTKNITRSFRLVTLIVPPLSAKIM